MARAFRRRTGRADVRAPPQPGPGLADAWYLEYDAEGVHEERVEAPWDRIRRPAVGKTAWLRVVGMGDASLLERIETVFGVHPLATEDAVDLDHRPKLDPYPAHHEVVLRALDVPAGRQAVTRDHRLAGEQVSIVFGEDFVVSIEASPPCRFDGVRKRLENPAHRRGADWLAYLLIDLVVDQFFPVVDDFAEDVDRLDEEVVHRPSRSTFETIHRLKRRGIDMRHVIAATRDVVSALARDPVPRVREETRAYLRDCHDHAVMQLESLDVSREMLSSMTDAYLSALSNRMNEVMKVLTVIATIFMPLTVLTGLYGMNFNPEASPYNMPELNWRYGYPAVLVAMLAIVAGMLWWFRRRKWL